MKMGQMHIDIGALNRKLTKLVRDVEIIKLAVVQQDDEGELTEWAKKELARAMKIPHSECISADEVEARIRAR